MAMKKRMRDFAGRAELTKESIIDQTYSSKISPDPSFPNPAERGTPFCKGREGGI